MHDFLRLIAFCLLVIAPFLALAILSGQAEGALFLIYPIAATIPACFLVFLFFIPTEKLLESDGLSDWKNVVVPSVGGFAGVLLMLLYDWRFRQKSTNLVIRAVGVFVVGMVLGIAWRLSEGLIRSFDSLNNVS